MYTMPHLCSSYVEGAERGLMVPLLTFLNGLKFNSFHRGFICYIVFYVSSSMNNLQ